MMSDTSNAGDDVSSRVIQNERVIAHSPAEIYAAFANPVRLARWWGPDGFSNRFDECDFRPGGAWRFVMIGPDGREYYNESCFRELIPAQRVVIDHLNAPLFVLTVTLSGMANGTLLTWHMLFESEAVRDAVSGIVPLANEQNLDRLEAELIRTP
jgi:uncharacterized protein YndB with AHSA1/START domain